MIDDLETIKVIKEITNDNEKNYHDLFDEKENNRLVLKNNLDKLIKDTSYYSSGEMIRRDLVLDLFLGTAMCSVSSLLKLSASSRKEILKNLIKL